MISCKLSKAKLFLDVNNSKPPSSEKTRDQSSFSIKNFRLLTSHLKSRKEIYEPSLKNESPNRKRPKTTPNFYWNFLNFEERKQQQQQESPSNIEKTLQRLNIRSFNNILRSNIMKKSSSPLFRNHTSAVKQDPNKLPKTKKLEYYTLEKIKYNNYKYQKISLQEENKKSFIKEKEKNIQSMQIDESSRNKFCSQNLIEKLKENKINYFEKNRFLLKKKFEKFYKMSESLRALKNELENANHKKKLESKIQNPEKNTLIPEDSSLIRDFIPLERFKWETIFFNELNYLTNVSINLQQKMNRIGKNELNETKAKSKNDHLINIQEDSICFI